MDGSSLETTLSVLPWAERPAVKKGELGESIVDDFLRGKRVIPYRPHYDGAHPFDRLCATADKRNVFIADIKAKPRRKFFPDTGINLKHYHEYKHISQKHGLRIFLFFVDESERRVYGNWLHVLEKPTVVVRDDGRRISYPLRGQGIIYFPLDNMQHVAEIDSEQAQKLKDLSSRNEKYVYE
jgi:hypothetical protein